jgi:hypothetical protein
MVGIICIPLSIFLLYFALSSNVYAIYKRSEAYIAYIPEIIGKKT